MPQRRSGHYRSLAAGCAALVVAALTMGATRGAAMSAARAAGPGAAPDAALDASGDVDRLVAPRTLRLDNGLTVVLQRVPGRPVVAVQAYYRVGARNEPTGVTGIAHFIEHMLFRGTIHFGLADVTGVIERAGGEWHGYTWLDGTTYFEAAPAALLPTLLKLEAERMTAARMAPDEVEPERGAVFQEYRGYQLDPRSDLADAVAMERFLQHPYRNNTMGWESDLAAITPDDLVAFYRRFYGPRNAVLAIAGDIDPADAERQVREQFGVIPEGGADPRLRTVEPDPEGQRRLVMERPRAATALLISFPAPGALEPRAFAALLVLDAVLGRAKGLSFERHSDDLTTGQPVDPGSRLGALLAANGPAASIGTALVATAYPYQYLIAATPAEGRTLVELERELFGTLAMTRRTIGEDALASARRRIAAADDLETDGLVEMTHELAFWTALGGIDRRAAIRREVEKVSLAEVKDAASRLVPERSVVGCLGPTGSGLASPCAAAAARTIPSEAVILVAPGVEPSPMAAPSMPVARAASASVATLDLKPAGRLIVDARPGQRTFVLRCALASPDAAPFSAGVTARLRGAAAALRADRDTRARLAGAGIAARIQDPDEEPFAERGALRIDLAGPADLLPQAVSLLAVALGKALRQEGTPAPGLSDDPPERALEMLAAARDEAWRDRATPDAAALGGAAQGGDVAAAGGPSPWRLVVAVVSPLERQAVGSALAPLAAAVDAVPRAPATAVAPNGDAAPPFIPGRRSAAIPGIAQGRLLFAFPGDADPAAQEAVAWLLHHNYSGRLGVKAIAQLGLVYGMESESVPGPRPLVWVSMGADPDALVRLDAALDAVLASARGGLTEEEVAAYRSYARGMVTVRLADPDRAARLWTAALLRGEDHRGPMQRAERAAGLRLEDVAAAARRMLDPGRRLTVIVGRGGAGSG